MSTDPSEEPALTTSADSPEKPKRRAGRQPKTTPKQSHTISVRLTDEEYEALATEAAEFRLSKGEVLRAVWLGTPDEFRARKPLTVAELTQRKQLLGMAGNLNQMTKQLHAGPDVREGAGLLVAQLRHLLAN